MLSKKIVNKWLKGFKVELHGTSYLQSLKRGQFKANEFDFFKKVFQGKEIVIFDVGANRGNKTAEFLQIFPSAGVHSFEPYKPLFDEIKNKFLHVQNVNLYNLGVSRRKGKIKFNVNKGVDTSSFLESKYTGLNSDAQVSTVEQLDLEVDTLDNITQGMASRINLLKLDIQGSELEALKGAEKLLLMKKIDVIFTESYFIQQYVGQPLFSEIVSFLLPFGYVIQDIYNPIYGDGKLAWCDVIFIRNDLKI